MSSPIILHHAAKDGVTCSSHQRLMGAQHGLPLDCCLFLSEKNSTEGNFAAERLVIEFFLDTTKVLSAIHVRIDCVGGDFYRLAKGPILCRKPSAKLMSIALADAVKFGFSCNSEFAREENHWRAGGRAKQGTCVEAWEEGEIWLRKQGHHRLVSTPCGFARPADSLKPTSPPIPSGKTRCSRA